MIMSNVAIDNDFLGHLIDIKGRPDLLNLIIEFFNVMGVSPEMHPLVYTEECVPNQKAITKNLFEDGVVKVSNFDIITSDPSRKMFYEMQVKKVYRSFMGVEYPCSNVCNDWKSRMSLGEVHTTVFCVMVGYDCFLSDDNDVASKLSSIINRIMSKPIQVKNRLACCEYIRQLPSGTHNLKRNDLRALAHR